MTQDEILEQGKNTGLIAIQITYGNNGYPQGLGDWGLTGFENFQDAEQFANENAVEVTLFSIRDGHQLWKKHGYTNKPLSSDDYLNDLGDNYSEISLENEVDFVKDEIQTLLSNGDFEKAKSLIDYLIEVEGKSNELEDDEILIKGDSFENVKKEMMSYHEDVTTWAIGVFVPKSLNDE